MCLCLCELFYSLPITLYEQITFLTPFQGHYLPYPSWSFVHAGFSAVLQIPASELETSAGRKIFSLTDLTRWGAIISALFCFACVSAGHGRYSSLQTDVALPCRFFGFGQDATKEYRSWLTALGRCVRAKRISSRVVSRGRCLLPQMTPDSAFDRRRILKNRVRNCPTSLSTEVN